jgi:hypothetical protein
MRKSDTHFNLKYGKLPKGEKGILVSRICGAVITDGLIYKQEKFWGKYLEKSYYLEIADEWKENIDLVSKWIEELINKKGSVRPYKGCWRYRPGNREFVEYLHSLGIPYGRKSSIVTIPKEILKSNDRYQIEFISTTIMFDGSIKLDGTIEFVTKSKKLRDQIVRILKRKKVRARTFKQRIDRWSSGWKYGFCSRSFDFFMKILKGPKRDKLILIRKGKKMSIDELLRLFPYRENSKIPFIEEIYSNLKKVYPGALCFRCLMRDITSKYKISFHRNTLLEYLNLLVKSKIIERVDKGWYRVVT